MRRILTEPGVAKIRRFGLGIVLDWEMLLAELIKFGLFRKKTLGYFVQRKKRRRRMLVSY